jgi:hypothetical protein
VRNVIAHISVMSLTTTFQEKKKTLNACLVVYLAVWLCQWLESNAL